MSKASDLVNGTIKVGATNLVIDDRFRIGGAEWLEGQAGKSFIEFIEGLNEVPSFRDLRLILTALAVQRHPDDEAEIIKTLRAVELTDIRHIFGQLKITDYEAKNSPEPKPATTKKKKPA